MSSYKSQPLASTRPVQRKTSSATQTMLSLHFGPKVHLDFVLQEFTPEMKRKEEERREKVKQAKKDEKERQKKAIIEKIIQDAKIEREKKTSELKKFSTGYK